MKIWCCLKVNGQTSHNAPSIETTSVEMVGSKEAVLKYLAQKKTEVLAGRDSSWYIRDHDDGGFSLFGLYISFTGSRWIPQETDFIEDEPPFNALHIEEAWRETESRPPHEGSLMRHVLMRALNQPELARNINLPVALRLLPDFIRDLADVPERAPMRIAVAGLVAQLAEVAMQDRPDVERFLAGRDPEPFI